MFSFAFSSSCCRRAVRLERADVERDAAESTRALGSFRSTSISIGNVALRPNISSNGEYFVDSCSLVLYAKTQVSINLDHCVFLFTVTFVSIFLRV